MLGAYHPRLLVLTTPSYTFNARFTAPDAPPSARQGYADPTGRTLRIFRHDDHKFEWTIEEFTDWCEQTAREWGYEVSIEGVGRPQEKDEWGRDEALGYASLCAAFTRKEGEGWEDARREGYERMKTAQTALCDKEHMLIASHRHVAHERARNPASSEEIATLVKTKMIRFHESSIAAGELWSEQDIAVACGGWFEKLIEAIEHNVELRLERVGSETMERWHVLFDGAGDEEALPADDGPQEMHVYDIADEDSEDDDLDEPEQVATKQNDLSESAVDWSADFAVGQDAADNERGCDVDWTLTGETVSCSTW